MNLLAKQRWLDIMIIYTIQKSFDKTYFNSSNNLIVKQLFKKHIEKLMHSLQMYATKGYVIERITIRM
jgi:predicted DNA-binding protein (MmcQ/YjbR family)